MIIAGIMLVIPNYLVSLVGLLMFAVLVFINVKTPANKSKAASTV